MDLLPNFIIIDSMCVFREIMRELLQQTNIFFTMKEYKATFDGYE